MSRLFVYSSSSSFLFLVCFIFSLSSFFLTADIWHSRRFVSWTFLSTKPKQFSCNFSSSSFLPYFFHYDLNFIHRSKTWSTIRRDFSFLLPFPPFFFALFSLSFFFKSCSLFYVSLSSSSARKRIYLCICVCVLTGWDNVFFLFPDVSFETQKKRIIRILFFFSLRACVFNSMRYSPHTYKCILSLSLHFHFFASLMCMFMNLLEDFWCLILREEYLSTTGITTTITVSFFVPSIVREKTKLSYERKKKKIRIETTINIWTSILMMITPTRIFSSFVIFIYSLHF